MNRANNFKINQEQLKKLTMIKIMIEETLALMNFLIQNKVLTNNMELENFKERMETIKDLIESSLHDYSDKTITEMMWEEMSEISQKELEEEILEIKNKSVSRKYRYMLKDYISELLEKLKQIELEDISIEYNKKVYSIKEIEQVYKYI